MQNTTNFNLKKPEPDDFYDIQDQNDNMDVIDQKMKEIDDKVNDVPTVDDIGDASQLNVTGATNIVQAVNNVNTKVNEHLADYVKHPAVATTTNVGNAYSVVLNPAPISYVDGLGLVLTINVDSTGASTINVNGLGAVPIKKANGNDVTNLKANGVYTLRYSSGNFILQGEGSEYGTATAPQVLEGYTVVTENGLVEGAMADYGNGYTNGQDGLDVLSVASNASVGRFDLDIPDGFHTKINAHILGAIPGNIKAGAKLGHPTDPTKQIAGTFTSDANAVAADILAGKTAYVNGNKVTGNIPIFTQGVDTPSIHTFVNGTRLHLNPGNGKYFNGGSVYHDDSELLPSNIVAGKTVLGLVGTASIESLGGIRFAKGTAAVNAGPANFTDWDGNVKNFNTILVSGLSFLPAFIIIFNGTRNSSATTFYTIYTRDLDSNYLGVIKMGGHQSGWLSTAATQYYADSYVYNGGFRLPYVGNLGFANWLAIG